jgi:hypothetical protein
MYWRLVRRRILAKPPRREEREGFCTRRFDPNLVFLGAFAPWREFFWTELEEDKYDGNC